MTAQPPPPGWQPGWQPGWPPRPVSGDDTTWAMLSHLSFFLLAIIAPLVIMLTKGNQSAYVRHHAVEALNFHITFTIAMIVSVISIILIIGIALVPAVAIAGLVFTIIATVAASRGEAYRYPINLRLVR